MLIALSIIDSHTNYICETIREALNKWYVIITSLYTRTGTIFTCNMIIFWCSTLSTPNDKEKSNLHHVNPLCWMNQSGAVSYLIFENKFRLWWSLLINRLESKFVTCEPFGWSLWFFCVCLLERWSRKKWPCFWHQAACCWRHLKGLFTNAKSSKEIPLTPLLSKIHLRGKGWTDVGYITVTQRPK